MDHFLLNKRDSSFCSFIDYWLTVVADGICRWYLQGSGTPPTPPPPEDVNVLSWQDSLFLTSLLLTLNIILLKEHVLINQDARFSPSNGKVLLCKIFSSDSTARSFGNSSELASVPGLPRLIFPLRSCRKFSIDQYIKMGYIGISPWTKWTLTTN